MSSDPMLTERREGKPSFEIENVPIVQRKPVSKVEKALLLSPVLITTIIGLALIGGRNDWLIRGSRYQWVARNRTSVQIAVQIVAHLMGLAQVSTLRRVANFSARHRLSRHTMRLQKLDVLASLSTGYVDWSVPAGGLTIILIVSLLALIPGAIWAGALTPNEIIVMESVSQAIATPTYTSDTMDLWTADWYATAPLQTNLGTFSYGGNRDRFNFMMTDGKQASSIDGQPPNMTKADQTKYTYMGRSYGVGASVGINDTALFDNFPQLRTYSYVENGYQSLWNCVYNTSVDSNFTQLANEQGHVIWSHTVLDPISGLYGYSIFSGGDTDIIGPIRANYTADVWRNEYRAPFMYITINVIGDKYDGLDNMQCAYRAIPTSFAVEVDVVKRFISVTPQATSDLSNSDLDRINIDSTGWLTYVAGDTIAALGEVSTTSYTSVLGDMLLQNVNNVNQSGIELDTDGVYLRGVAESMQALADQQLFGSAGAQLMIAKEAEWRDAVLQLAAMQVGAETYVYLAVAVNAVVVLVTLIEAARTRLWRGMTDLNIFGSTKTAIVAAWEGSRNDAETAPAGGDHGIIEKSKIALSNGAIILR